MKLIHNRAKCKSCGDVIESMYRHDLVACSCFTNTENNTGIFVAGGHNYQRAGGNLKNFQDLSEWEEEHA